MCTHIVHSQFNGALREETMGSTAHEKSWSGLSKASGGGEPEDHKLPFRPTFLSGLQTAFPSLLLSYVIRHPCRDWQSRVHKPSVVNHSFPKLLRVFWGLGRIHSEQIQSWPKSSAVSSPGKDLLCQNMAAFRSPTHHPILSSKPEAGVGEVYRQAGNRSIFLS